MQSDRGSAEGLTNRSEGPARPIKHPCGGVTVSFLVGSRVAWRPREPRGNLPARGRAVAEPARAVQPSEAAGQRVQGSGAGVRVSMAR